MSGFIFSSSIIEVSASKVREIKKHILIVRKK